MHITTPQNDIDRILFSPEQIARRVAEMGAQLTEAYQDKLPVMVCILKGASPFYIDLCRQMQCNLHMDFIVASSYGEGTATSGNVKIKKDLENDIAGRHVVLVEDIVDSGLTLQHLRRLLEARSPASVRICCLLDKVAARKVPLVPEYRGFEVGNEFVVGYGLDYAEYYRNLPYIGVLKPEVYAD